MGTIVDFGIMFSGTKMASISEEDSEISDFEGFTEEDLAVNISTIPDSDLIVLILKFLQLVAVTFLTLGRVRMKRLKI